jgi:ankyrin repeat protein
LQIVELLLEFHADPNLSENCEETALQLAAREGRKEIVDILIENGANVDAPAATSFGATALQFAAIGGYLGIVSTLLENQADVNAAPAMLGGRTALEGAAEHGRIDMVKLLINAGANVHPSHCRRAIKYALSNGHHATRELLPRYLPQETDDIPQENSWSTTEGLVPDQHESNFDYNFDDTFDYNFDDNFDYNLDDEFRFSME